MTEAPPQPSVPSAPQSVPPSVTLLEKIAAVRTKHLAVEAGSGIASALGLAVLLLAVGMFADWMFDFAWGLRALLLAVDAAVVVSILVRHVFLPIARQPDDDAVALMVERGKPEFRSRLIATLQLTRPGAIAPNSAAALVQALVVETETIAAPVRFTDVVDAGRCARLCIAAALIAGAGAFVFVQGEDVSRDLLKRAFLSHEVEVPRKTRIASFTGDVKIARGDNITIEALAKGFVPATGKLLMKFASGRTQEFPLDSSAANRARFTRELENVQDSFTYRVVLNDGRSREARVDAIVRPVVANIDCQQVFPAYTKLGTVRRGLGDLTLLAGSRLVLKVTASKEISRGVVRLLGMTNEVPLKVEKSSAEVTAEIPIPSAGLAGFSVHLVDKFDMESKDDAVYRIDVLPDRVPVVRITYPERKEELITQLATVLVGFEAVDDFAVEKVFLRYRIDDGPAQGVEMVLEDRTQRGVRRRYEWKVGALKPLVQEGSLIEYWVEAHDNNDVTGPGIGASEHYVAKVVSEAEKRADLMARVGDYIGSIGDVAKDQETLSKRLGDVIQGRPEQK